MSALVLRAESDVFRLVSIAVVAPVELDELLVAPMVLDGDVVWSSGLGLVVGAGVELGKLELVGLVEAVVFRLPLVVSVVVLRVEVALVVP